MHSVPESDAVPSVPKTPAIIVIVLCKCARARGVRKRARAWRIVINIPSDDRRTDGRTDEPMAHIESIRTNDERIYCFARGVKGEVIFPACVMIYNAERCAAQRAVVVFKTEAKCFTENIMHAPYRNEKKKERKYE